MTHPGTPQTVDIQGESEPDFVEVYGLKTAYRRSGEGEPLLLLHGMGLANSWLRSTVLLAENFDVLAPQHPGFGRTPRPAWYRTLDDSVAHYADLLDEFELDRVHVLGHSFGGVFAGAFAATYPERVRSLTILAPLALPVIRPPEEEQSHRGEEAPPNLMELLFNESYEQYAEYDPAADMGMFVAEKDDEYSDPSQWQFDPSPGTYRRLARVTTPRQIIVPTHDQVVSEDVAKDWARWLDAPIVTISGETASTGHMVNEQEPEKFVEAVVALSKLAEK